MVAKFATTEDKPAGFRLRLMAVNGEIIANSESYDSTAAATNGIAWCR